MQDLCISIHGEVHSLFVVTFDFASVSVGSILTELRIVNQDLT